MAKLKDEQVKHVTKLAKLEISKKDFNKFKNQLSEVISYVDELSEVDTSNVKETSRALESTNVYRKDSQSPSLKQDAVLSGTDRTHNGYFLVPAILERKDEDI